MLDYLVLVAVALSILGFVAWVIVLLALVFSWKLGQIVNQSQLAMAIWPLRGICLCFALATLPTKPLVSLVLVAPLLYLATCLHQCLQQVYADYAHAMHSALRRK